ncbi:MAG TPA: NAD-dependent epimerase/dehydratase family protein [Planctomycetaceae bacterium]|nr:NAD-dependent epimerase/dehydratase family protein [Planctomycetaceae bacterium]
MTYSSGTPPRTVLITGSSGLIGSEAVTYFHGLKAHVHGIDNNMRAEFFGPTGDTTWNLARLKEECPGFVHHAVDIRDRPTVLRTIEELRPDLIIHAAAQPSHDLAAERPFDDFDVNAVGTLNLLEATRRFAGDAVFIHMSTNKVYGDAPNRLPLIEHAKRYDYSRPEDWPGVDESMTIDQSLHSLFGASKVAADVIAQEYGRYFGLKTCVFRGGCLTGSRHSGAMQHGFLNYLFRVAAAQRPYSIFGYKGKQVRDQIHSLDVIRAMEAVFHRPRPGAVYNLGGGRDNSASVLECIDRVDQLSARKLTWDYVEQERKGDHICYITNLARFRTDYPEWTLEWSLDRICEDIWKAARGDSGR